MTADAVGFVLEALAMLAILALAASVLQDLLRRRRSRANLDRLAERTRGEAEPGEEPSAEPILGLRRVLNAAGLYRVGPLTWFAATVLLAAIVALAVRAILPGFPLAALVAALVAAYLLWLGVKAWGRHRARRFEAKLVDAVGFMVGGLKAGENLTQAFSSAANAAQGSVRKEFREAAHRLQLGMTIRRALRRIDQGYDSEGTRLFVRTVIAKWQAGGDLAPILETVNQVIRDRLRIKMRLHSQTAGARLALTISAFVPYLLIPFFLSQRPDWIDRLVNHPLGPRLLFTAVMLQILGLVWMRRVTRIEL